MTLGQGKQRLPMQSAISQCAGAASIWRQHGVDVNGMVDMVVNTEVGIQPSDL